MEVLTSQVGISPNNKRLNSVNVKLSWFWQTTQKAMPTHCVLGGRYNDGRNEAQQPFVKLDSVRQNTGLEVRCFTKYFMVFLSAVNTD